MNVLAAQKSVLTEIKPHDVCIIVAARLLNLQGMGIAEKTFKSTCFFSNSQWPQDTEQA